MVEYQGRIDENGKALGHGPKVLNEYFDFIKDYCQVSVYAPREMLNEFRGAKISHETKILPGKIVMGQDKTVLIKIKNKLNMFNTVFIKTAYYHCSIISLSYTSIEIKHKKN